MLKIVIIILSILFLVFLVYAFIHTRKTNKILKDVFKNNSVIVFGRKGKGKDLLFQKVIYLRKKEPYLSNISYGYKGSLKPINTLNLDPNTYENFINDNIVKVDNMSYEKHDYYLSDGGIHLPSQEDHFLHKKYKSFPLYYALSRHLYLQNIHINVQALNRLWKAAREQADYYIKCRRVVKLPFIMVGYITTYEKYSSADNELLPMGNRIFNKFSKAEQDQYSATNGKIENRFYFILKKHIKYDTRYFKNVVLK